MKVALVLGGAECLQEDMAAALALGSYAVVTACNEAITVWPDRLDAAVTLHPEKLAEWLATRRAAGFPEPSGYYTFHGVHSLAPPGVVATHWGFPGQDTGESATSGIFAAKVALVELGCDRAVLCGIPFTVTPHFFDPRPWSGADHYIPRLAFIPDEWRARIRSMSGNTGSFFGKPGPDFFL